MGTIFPSGQKWGYTTQNLCKIHHSSSVEPPNPQTQTAIHSIGGGHLGWDVLPLLTGSLGTDLLNDSMVFRTNNLSANLMDKGTSRNQWMLSKSPVDVSKNGCCARFSFLRELAPGFGHIPNFVHQKASPFMTNATKCCDSDSCQLVHRFTCWQEKLHLEYLDGVLKSKHQQSRKLQKVHHFLNLMYVLPSGKHTKNYGESPCLMGKSTINGHFQ